MKYMFDVPDVSCNHCKMRIESALNALEGVQSAVVDVENRTVSAESELPPEKLIETMDDAGYSASVKS